MELIYAMRRKPLKCEPPLSDSVSDPEVPKPLCVISAANIIAFSSATELSDIDGETWGGHVYVCDLDTPWESHKVTSTIHPVTALEWDSEGKQLLVGTAVGEVSVFGQKDFLLNEWTCLYSASFPGEPVIKATFFHTGRRVILTEKKPDALIPDKIQLQRSAPTLKGFGGAASEGVCVVLAASCVGVVIPHGQGGKQTECLYANRELITAAHIMHHNGNILLATLSRSAPRFVRCSCVSVSLCRSGTAPALTVQPMPSVALADSCRPTSISWCIRDDTESLLIAGATLSLWKLSERLHPPHKLLCKQGPHMKPTSFNTLCWQQSGSWPLNSERAVCLSVCPTYNSTFTATLTKTSIYTNTLSAHLLQTTVNTCSVKQQPRTNKHKYGSVSGPFLCDVAVSHLGGVIVSVDSRSQLSVHRAPANNDTPTPISVQHTLSLLEYSMVSGNDSLDVIMTLKPAVIEALYDRLTESFQRQSPAFQQYYYQSWLNLRIALCRVLPGAQSSASHLVSHQMLHCVWAACVTALRADDSWAALLEDHNPNDQEKTLLSLEASADVVADPAVLQALRRPLQRVVDTAYTVLATVKQHGRYELWSDHTALNLLRKLLLIARSRGRSDAVLRALARLAACNTPNNDLLEECLALTSQLSSPRVWESLPRCNVSSPHGRPWPLYLEYGIEPESLRYTPEPPPQLGDTAPTVAMDSIRYMYIGGGAVPPRWRQCGRCGTRALPAALPARHPAQRAHDACFAPSCRCGGKWTLFSNV